LIVELIHKKFFKQAKKEWIKISLFSIILVLLGLLIFITIYLVLKINNIYLIDKFTDLLTIIILIIGMFALQIINCLNIAIRSFGKELLMYVNVTSNLITGIMIIIMGKNYSVTGVAITFSSIILLISIPWEIMILNKLWKENVRD
jgi:hypothetical protein